MSLPPQFLVCAPALVHLIVVIILNLGGLVSDSIQAPFLTLESTSFVLVVLWLLLRELKPGDVRVHRILVIENVTDVDPRRLQH